MQCILSVVISIMNIAKIAFIYIRALLLKIIILLHSLKSSYVTNAVYTVFSNSILTIARITLIPIKMLLFKIIILLQCLKSCYVTSAI